MVIMAKINNLSTIFSLKLINFRNVARHCPQPGEGVVLVVSRCRRRSERGVADIVAVQLRFLWEEDMPA